MSDAEELQEILLGCGILKAQERKPRKPRKSPHLPKTVTLADGIRLSVGRNAMQKVIYKGAKCYTITVYWEDDNESKYGGEVAQHVLDSFKPAN